MDLVELERLLVELRPRADALEFPRRHVREVVVVALRFTVGGLAFFAEVAARGLLALERVEREQFGELEVVGDAPGVLEALVQVVGSAWHRDVVPELLAQLWNCRQRAPQA